MARKSGLEEEVERYGGADPSRLGGMGRRSSRQVREEERASRRKAERGKGRRARRRVLKGRTGQEGGSPWGALPSIGRGEAGRRGVSFAAFANKTSG